MSSAVLLCALVLPLCQALSKYFKLDQPKRFFFSKRHICTAEDMFVQQKTCLYSKRHVSTEKDMFVHQKTCFFSAKVMFVHQKTCLYSNTNVCTAIYMFVQQKTYLYSKRHVLTEIHRRASRLWTTLGSCFELRLVFHYIPYSVKFNAQIIKLPHQDSSGLRNR